MPFLKVVLLVAAVALVWWVVTSHRASRGTTGLRFTAVEDLAPEVRDTIDSALERGRLVTAIEHYRAATGAGLKESKAAVETRRWRTTGEPR
jgi:ribosomal protein L7/L12